MTRKTDVRAAFKTALEHVSTSNTNAPLGTRSYLTDPTTVVDYIHDEAQVMDSARPYVGFVQAPSGYTRTPMAFLRTDCELLLDVYVYTKTRNLSITDIVSNLEDMLEDIDAAIERDVTLGGAVTYCFPEGIEEDNVGKLNTDQGWARARYRCKWEISTRTMT